MAGDALADDVRGTRSEKLRETSHVIDARVDARAAKLVVRRTVFNGGSRHDQGMFWIDVPQGGVATGLRTLGLQNDRPFWFPGELLEAEAAAEKYRELTGIGGYYPKDPALLSWRSQDLLALQVFPVPPSQPKTVEYTFLLPTHYAGGKYHVDLGPMGTSDLAATAAFSPANPGDTLYLDGKRVPAGSSVVLKKDELDVAITRKAQPTLDGGLTTIALKKDRSLAQLHFEAAPKLSQTPKGAYVVVLIDASRSIDANDSASMVAAARAYLSHFEDAQATVLLFDREVRPLDPGFVPVKRAIGRLAKLTVDPRNGSGIDAALARADALLAAAPSKAARRIVLMTDLRTRAALDPERVKGTLKSGALLHIGTVIASGEPALGRDDDDAWSGVALGTGGVLWRAAASTEASNAAEMRRVFEEWARPVRVHDVSVMVHKRNKDPEELALSSDTLDEGEGIEELRVADEAITRVELRGSIWATPTTKAILPSERDAALWSALVFGSSVFSDLNEDEMMDLAMRGRAVSPVTSYLAIEPGVRPSTEGLDHGSGAMGFGSGFGRMGTILSGSSGGRSSFDHREFLRAALATAWRACGGAGGATVTLETTLEEVVDVPSVKAEGSPAASAQCLEKAAWALELPGAFTAEWSSFTVSL